MNKHASKPYVAGLSPEVIEANNALKAQALRNILKAGLLGVGGGATLATLLGLPQVINKPKIPSYPLQTEVELPYPQEVKSGSAARIPIEVPLLSGAFEAATTPAKDRTEGALYGGAHGIMQGAAALPGAAVGDILGQKALLRMGPSQTGRLARMARKPVIGSRQLLPVLGSIAGGTASSLAARPLLAAISKKTLGPPPEPAKKEEKKEKKADWADAVARSTMSASPGDPAPTIGSPRWMRGDVHTAVNAIPWAAPAALGAGLVGLWGGHEAIRKILRSRRKAELDQDLKAAQKEYEEAMLSQYDPSKLRSLSGAKEASSQSALDVCFDAMEKRGFLGFDFNNIAGRGASAYLALAGLLGTGAGVGMYKWLQARSGEKTLKDALKRRAALRGMQNPAELYVRPVPVEYIKEKEENT